MKYILKKTAVFLATVLVVSLLAFLAFQVIPGDPTSKLLGTEATPEKVAALREELGLNRNVFIRYGEWLLNFIRGDFGVSYSYSTPVRELLAGKTVSTAALSLMAWLMVIVISIPSGILLARCKGHWIDRFFVSFNQVMMSIPPFFIGMVFTTVFGLLLHLFVPGNFIPLKESPAGFLGYLIFPALAIAIPKAAMVIKLLRSGILSEMGEDYVRTAYSRGNSRWAVISGHVLRNAVIPVVTFLAMTLADIVAGSIIIEQVFVIPGIGRLLLVSIANRDYPVVQAIVVMIAFIVVLMNYLADIATQYIDPRIRLS